MIHYLHITPSQESLSKRAVETKDYYIVERRSGNIQIEDANCFLSQSMDQVICWMKENSDFDDRKKLWWWAIIKITLEDELGGELFKVFDWDGNELDGQPTA